MATTIHDARGRTSGASGAAARGHTSSVKRTPASPRGEAPLTRATHHLNQDGALARVEYPRHTKGGPRPTTTPLLDLANLAYRRVVDTQVDRAVAPEDPLSVGRVYEPRRAVRLIRGPLSCPGTSVGPDR